MLFGFFAVLLMVLGHRAARVPGSSLKTMSPNHMLLVMVGVGFCGSWGETMRQLALVARTRQERNSRH